MTKKGKSQRLTKKDIKLIVLGVIIGGAIIGMFKGFTGVSIEDFIANPVYNYLHPPFASLRIEPIKFPMISLDGKQIIRVSLTNNGTEPLENILIDYTMPCIMNETKREVLEHTNYLNPRDSDYLEFEAKGLNTSCSIIPEPLVINIYKDKFGRKYTQFINATSNVCMYCELRINITANNYKFFYNYTYWYPYFTGEITLSGGIVNGSLPYEKALNKSDLIYEGNVRMIILDTSTACLRGDITMEECEALK